MVARRESPVPPGQWFTLEVIAQGNHIVIRVNGKTTADYTDEKRPYSSGHIALQQHDPETVAEFRKIEIKELNRDSKPNTNPPAVVRRSRARPSEYAELTRRQKNKMAVKVLIDRGLSCSRFRISIRRPPISTRPSASTRSAEAAARQGVRVPSESRARASLAECDEALGSTQSRPLAHAPVDASSPPVPRPTSHAALAECDEAVRLDPRSAFSHVALASVYRRRSFTSKLTTDLDLAVAELDIAIRFDPNRVQAFALRAGIMSERQSRSGPSRLRRRNPHKRKD